MSSRAQHHSFLASLHVGDVVTITRDGRDNTVTVQRSLHRSDPGGFGSWDHSKVTVGYGPGRWNTEVSAAGLEAGHYSLSRSE